MLERFGGDVNVVVLLSEIRKHEILRRQLRAHGVACLWRQMPQIPDANLLAQPLDKLVHSNTVVSFVSLHTKS